ncbi:MAG: 6-bladed beta-propeller [Rikenellaceae bacterium]|jgi:hypothetical protein|nr:6-bladed beta-propeller [Rikenellaceae bacterium]
MRNTIFFISLLLLIGSCGNRKTTNQEDKSSIYNIVLSDALKSKQQFKLSDIAESFEYVELKTPPGMVIMAVHIAVSKEYIFVTCKGEVYQFSMSGDFIRPVGRIGRGPGEYLSAMDVVVDEKNRRVSIMSYPAIYHYSFDGSFLGSVEMSTYDDLLIVSDSLIYASSVPFGYQTYKLLSLDSNKDTLGGIPNHNLFNTNGYTVMLSQQFREPFYKHNNQVYFKGYQDNDTIWRMDGSDYATHAVIDMGRYKYPEPTDVGGMENWHRDFIAKTGDFYQVNKAQEDDDYIYLTCEPYYNPKMGSPRVMFDKATGVGFSAVTASGEAGIEDDMLRGPAFWPEIITEDRYISVVEAYKLLEATEDATDLAPEFKTFIDGINENTNTIVAIAKRGKINQ